MHDCSSGDKHLEIGAQWIHGEENNPLYEMAAANNMVAGEGDSDTDSSLNAFDEPWENQFFTQDGRRVDPEIVRETCLVLDGIFSEADKFHRENKPVLDENESMGTFVFDTFYKYLRTTGYSSTAEQWQVREALFQWRLQLEAADCGCKSLYEMSAGAWGEFRECQGEDVTLLYGYQALLNLLLADIPEACFRVNTPVQCVYWDQQHPQPPNAATKDVPINPTAAERNSRDYPVAVRTKSGELLPADHVIFTSSLGVLKKSAHYLFKPILPRDKMAAIHRLGFGTVDKVYLEWEKPWWSKDMHAVQLAWMPDEPFVLDRQESVARSGGVCISNCLFIEINPKSIS
jgi:spermine oxidase